MNNGPVTDAMKLSRLPKWAQERIKRLERSQEEARDQMQSMLEHQPQRKSFHSHEIYTEDYVMNAEEKGPGDLARRYFMASSFDVIMDNGIRLTINPTSGSDGEPEEIRLYFSLRRGGGEGFKHDVGIFPAASNSIVLRKIKRVE